MRELVGGQGCGADGSSGAANPLSRLLQDGAAARARGDQLQRFQAAGGGQLQGMMGPAMIGGSSEEAMAAQFHHEMMAQEMMAAQHVRPRPRAGPDSSQTSFARLPFQPILTFRASRYS